ncbi:hypothetical protein GX50_04330 [[Emmonsia] crescens]|uniref:Uncharacterized protein n=1 Tax=[Emmonsia] crescens TaxID=73230 RepID=A0A2B7ZIM1_9EURO|nr:hypothetical protein GX50_04330 [Emmonsia crescens]
MSTRVTCCCDLCTEAAATLGTPWDHIDGETYNGNQIKWRGVLTAKEELYDTSSRLSPSKTRDTRIYFLEFCKASLIRSKEMPENIPVPELVAFSVDRDNLIPLACRYLRSIAKAIEWYNMPKEGEGFSKHWHLFVARAQNLWPVLEREMQHWPKSVKYSALDYNHKVLGIANEFRFRDERLDETHPYGYETHGVFTADELISNLSLDRHTPDGEQQTEGQQAEEEQQPEEYQQPEWEEESGRELLN